MIGSLTIANLDAAGQKYLYNKQLVPQSYHLDYGNRTFNRQLDLLWP
jgi:hypothetical protein